jgi:hypothetical protein
MSAIVTLDFGFMGQTTSQRVKNYGLNSTYCTGLLVDSFFLPESGPVVGWPRNKSSP